MRIKVNIPLEAVSKENSRRVFKNRKGSPILAKSAPALAFERDCKRILRPIHPLLEGEIKATGILYYSSNRKDLDASLVFDVLQGIVYKNDRQIRSIHLEHAIDKNNPRCELVFEPRQGMLELGETAQILDSKTEGSTPVGPRK